MRLWWQSICGSISAALGIFVAFITAAQATWSYTSHGETDILARLPLLLGGLLPSIAVVSMLVAAAMLTPLLRHRGFSRWQVFGSMIPALAVVGAVALIPSMFFPARIFSRLPRGALLTANFLLAAVLVIVGYALVHTRASSRQVGDPGVDVVP